MKSAGGFWLAIRSLVYNYTGFGKKPEGFSAESEALAAVFMPAAALTVGTVSVALVSIVRLTGLFAGAVVAGLAVMAVFGGMRRFKAVSSLFAPEGRAAGTAAATVLVLTFEVFAIYETAMYKVNTIIYPALLYLPVAGAVAMLSAASATKPEESPGMPLSAVKGWHMILASALAFVLMLPEFGLISLAFVASSVLAGSLTALAMQRRSERGEAVYLAAVAAELLFLLLLILLERPVVYY